jgi:hypothetical protein
MTTAGLIVIGCYVSMILILHMGLVHLLEGEVLSVDMLV